MSTTKVEAERDGIVVPTTLQEYCVMAKPRTAATNSLDMADFYDDDYMDDDDLDDDDDDNLCYDDEDDSGHGDS